MSTSTSATTKATLYEVVSGQRPRKDFFVLQELANQGQLHEAEIGPEMFEDEAAHESQVNDGEDEPSQVEDEDGQPEPLNFYRTTLGCCNKCPTPKQASTTWPRNRPEHTHSYRNNQYDWQ